MRFNACPPPQGLDQNGVSAANGGLDWLSMARGSQYALVVVTCLAMAVVTTPCWHIRGLAVSRD
jgi:hypothetical protein